MAHGRAVASAPGRVTLLGEHTDYNAGCSLGVATAQRTVATVTPTGDGIVHVRSTSCGTASCALGATDAEPFALVAASLTRAAGLGGARVEVDGDVPVGAGLSSSASYAVAVALALGLDGDDVAVARACQLAERDAGSDVGLLDQLVVLSARAGCVVALDFATLEIRTFPLALTIGLSVVDTGVARLVATSEYATRRAQCEAAALVIGPLGRASEDAVDRLGDPPLRRRARHVVGECRRARAAEAPLRSGDLAGFGALLDEGHASLRDDFEASDPRVEVVRDELRRQRGVAGVRLTGAGFGGCLLVAHDPAVALDTKGRWCSPLRGGDGASLSSPR